MKRTQVLIAILVVMVGGLATVSLAQQQRAGMKRMHGRMGMGPMGMRYEQLVARLKLTPEQETQIKGIAKSRAEQSKGDREAGRAAREALMRELFSDKPNTAEIQKNTAVLQQESAQRLTRWVTMAQEMNKVLTPEQRTEMQKMVSEHQQASQRMRERFKQRMQDQQQNQQPVQ